MNEESHVDGVAGQSGSNVREVSSESNKDKSALIIVGDHDKTVINYLLGQYSTGDENEFKIDNKYYSTSVRLYTFSDIENLKCSTPILHEDCVQAVIYYLPKNDERSEMLNLRKRFAFDLEMIAVDTLSTNDTIKLEEFCIENGIIAHELHPNEDSLLHYEDCNECYGCAKIYEDLMTVQWKLRNDKALVKAIRSRTGESNELYHKMEKICPYFCDDERISGHLNSNMNGGESARKELLKRLLTMHLNSDSDNDDDCA